MKHRQVSKKERDTSSSSKVKSTAVSAPREYVYHNLKDLLKKELDRINIYAAILDCSGIYYVKNVQKYVCTVKLIDETIDPTSHITGSSGYLNVTMFSRSISRLPRPTQIGSILRIHRGQTKKNKGEFQLNCDVNIKGAWATFDPIDNVNPITESGRTHTFTSKDKVRLKDIRKFAKSYFENNFLESTSLEDANKKKLDEFDSTCYVLDIKVKEISTRILLCDKTKVIKLYIASKQRLSFNPFTVVRLRSAVYKTEKEKTFLELNDYSNIISVPSEYKSAVDMIEAIKSKTIPKEVLEEIQYYMHDLTSSSISHPTIKKPKVVHLKDLYSRDLSKSSEKVFRVNVNVVEMGPKNPSDWICVIDKNKNHCTFKDVLKKNKAMCGNMDYYFKLQLFVKDNSVTTDNNLYLIFLCTVDGKGKEFIKLPQSNRKPDEEYFKALKRVYKMLVKPWSVLDCIVELVDTDNGQPVFFLVDTCLDLK